MEIKDKTLHTRKKAIFLVAIGKASDMFSDLFSSYKKWKEERQGPPFPTESVQEVARERFQLNLKETSRG